MMMNSSDECSSNSSDDHHFILNFTGILLSKELTEKKLTEKELTEKNYTKDESIGRTDQQFFKLLILLPFPTEDELSKTPLWKFPSYIPLCHAENQQLVSQSIDSLMQRLQTDAFPVGRTELSCLISSWTLKCLLFNEKKKIVDCNSVVAATQVVLISAYGQANLDFFERQPVLSVVNFRQVHLKPDEVHKNGYWLWLLHELNVNGDEQIESLPVCPCVEVKSGSDFAKSVYRAVLDLVRELDLLQEPEKEEGASTDFEDDSDDSFNEDDNDSESESESDMMLNFKYSKADEHCHKYSDYKRKQKEDRKLVKSDRLQAFTLPPERSTMFYSASNSLLDSLVKCNHFEDGKSRKAFSKGFVPKDNVVIFEELHSMEEEDQLIAEKGIAPLVKSRL